MVCGKLLYMYIATIFNGYQHTENEVERDNVTNEKLLNEPSSRPIW